MTEAVLYQSILQKLGQLSPKGLPEVDAFLTFLVSQQGKGKKKSSKSIAHLFGAWKDWNEQEFQDFLEHTTEARNDLFATREL